MLGNDRIFVNETYMVQVRYTDIDKNAKMDGWLWLSIKRHDKEVINDWRIMQNIKNAIAGEEREGVELYPAESRLVDTSNQFHIFVLPKGQRFPVGYADRCVVKGHDNQSKQRPFDVDPEDAITIEEARQKINEVDMM